MKKWIKAFIPPVGIFYIINGIGKTRGFEIVEILLVAHGGNHNDTIVTVERKLPTLI